MKVSGLKLLSQFVSVVVLAAMLGLPSGSSAAGASGDDGNPMEGVDFTGGYESDSLEIKFVPESGLAVTNGRLSGDQAKIGQLADILGSGNVRSARSLFGITRTERESLANRARRVSGKSIPALEDYYKVELSRSVDMNEVIAQLHELEFVESAFPTAIPTEPPSATPDYTGLETYHRELGGLNVDFAHEIDGGKGEHVRIADLEYDWNIDHEELSTVTASDRLFVGEHLSPFNNNNHGTAVASILVGDHNGYGVNGIVPEADLKLINTFSSNYGWSIPRAIYKAMENLGSGDVILLEQQVQGPTPGLINDYVPVEWVPSTYDAIVAAVALGIHVVQAAGNGSQNLDDAELFGESFPMNKPDSGSIIVGASDRCYIGTDSRAGFSTYGSRVDVYADGSCVAAAGYGYAYAGDGDPNRFYTESFSGTSSASAIVAGAVASLSSIGQEVNRMLTPAQLRAAMKSTGVPQNPIEFGNIGFKPQIKQSIFVNNNVALTTCYTGGYGENFFLHIAKNHYNIATTQATQKYTATLLGNAYTDRPTTNPISFTQTGSVCHRSGYNRTDIELVAELAEYTELSYSDAQAYSAVLIGYLILIWT